MKYFYVINKIKDNICTIILNKKKTLNALDSVLCQELLSALERCKSDKKARAIVLTGEGKAFCAGGDIFSMIDFIKRNPTDSPARIIEKIVNDFHPVIKAIRKMPKPVIGAVSGFCSGGGAGLALACDILIGGESAKIDMAYAKIGQAADGGTSFFLSRQLGRYKAAEIFFKGLTLDANTCFQLGLFNHVVPDEKVLLTAETLAKELALGPVYAFGKVKELINSAISTPTDFESHLDLEKAGVIACAETLEFREGINAFIEKRRPNFFETEPNSL